MNYKNGNPFVTMKGPVGASFVAAAFCLMQKSPIDKAMYYDAMPTRSYCGLYHFPSMEVTHTYYSFKMFNLLYQLGIVAETNMWDQSVAALSATNGTQGAILLANHRHETVQISLNTTEKVTTAFLTNQENLFKEIEVDNLEKMTLPAYSVMLICCNGAENQIHGYEKQEEIIKFAGLG